MDEGDMHKAGKHLTNTSLVKNHEDYNATHGSKWSIDNFRFYLE